MDRRTWFDSPEFAEQFHTDAPLGAFCGPEGTEFRLWAPTAQQVQLQLYAAGDGGEALQTVAMTSAEKGTWTYRTGENLHGRYYTYLVTVDGVCRCSQDPYARACGVNGLRSMVLDLATTDPEGWAADAPPAPAGEQIIYELHVRDFSWDPAGGFDPVHRGKYSALTCPGTRYGLMPTGLDYLQHLGVTHVQLMPVYDYGSVDERCPEGSYNWGYDPVNYNIPEGSYSSDPYRGQVRIRELKQAIMALHSRGLRVVMDVVYNHTYNLENGLEKTVPGYYYRQNADGSLSNGSGCGNDVATERSMCTRYILESVLYWAEEYHIDGFRFDLMGLMDAPLMNSIRQRLDGLYGQGEKLIYGEPWRAGATAARPGTVLCTKDDLRALKQSIGAFSDDTRDAVKGSVMAAESVGFVNGGRVSPGGLANCVRGWAGEGYPAAAPSQTITYLSCHDDWTLWDKLVYTMDPDKNFAAPNGEVLRANRLAAAMAFCCQGRLFLHGGEEFGRTKNGIRNSYCSSAEVNQMDWKRAAEYRQLVDYYRGLIALRKRLPGLTDKGPDAGSRILQTGEHGENCVSLCLDNRGDSPWSRVLMVFNCSGQERQVDLPQGTWELLVDGRSSFRYQAHITAAGICTLPPKTACILGLLE